MLSKRMFSVKFLSKRIFLLPLMGHNARDVIGTNSLTTPSECTSAIAAWSKSGVRVWTLKIKQKNTYAEIYASEGFLDLNEKFLNFSLF